MTDQGVPTEDDIYVLAQSDARIDKESGMRRKRLRRYVTRRFGLQRLLQRLEQWRQRLQPNGKCSAAFFNPDKSTYVFTECLLELRKMG